MINIRYVKGLSDIKGEKTSDLVMSQFYSTQKEYTQERILRF